MRQDALRTGTPAEQFSEISRGTVDLQVDLELKQKLERSYATGKPLLIKAGFDPNRPDLHLGHSLLLTRMRRFQDFGHRVVFLIGDFTALIGDPTGKNVTRPPMTREEVLANAETYKRQVFKVLDHERTTVRFNSEWLDALGSEGLVRLAARYSVARMLERDDFKNRFREGRSIAIHEMLYPLLQGYDSVALKPDVELGSTDQLFNLLMGRQLMREYGLAPQVIMTGPILEGLDAKVVDGVLTGDKMSKSLDNYIGIDEPAEQIFGKLMSISDDLMWRYYELLSSKPLTDVQALRQAVSEGREHPKTAKVMFAKEIVARFCGPTAAEAEAEKFEQRFSKRKLDADSLPLVRISMAGGAAIPLVRVLVEAKLASSNSDARRLIVQGGVKLNREKVGDPKLELAPGECIVEVGKLKAARVQIS